MAERMTKSYADKHAEIQAKKDALDKQDKSLSEKEKDYYPKAGDVLFTVLEAGDVKELRTKWNSAAPEDMKIGKIKCDVDIPEIDMSLAMSNPKKFAKDMKEFHKATDVQKTAAGEALSNVLHVSVLGDLRNKLRELGILNDGAEEVVDEQEEETLEDVNLEDVLAQEQAEQQSEATDSSEYLPYM